MRRYLTLIAVLFLSVLSACSDSTGPSGSIAGSYTLRTINGAPLPYVEYEEPGYREELTAETLQLNESGTFSLQSSYRETDGGIVRNYTEVESGTYTREGTAVTFRFDAGGTATGSLADNKIIIGIQGFSLVYQK